jgi:uncharacterized membrane protein
MHPSMVRALAVASPRRFTVVRLRERIRDTFWIIPAVFLIASGALAYGVRALDRSLAVDAGSAPWWVGTPEDASAVLQVIATSTLTFLGVVFSITLVALQLASQQFSPRVTRTYARSTTTKVTLGIFVATFVFALLTLAAQEGAQETPARLPSRPSPWRWSSWARASWPSSSSRAPPSA